MCFTEQGSLLGGRGISHKILFVLYFPLPYIFFNQGGLPPPGKREPGLTVPVSEQDDTQFSFHPSQKSSHKENTHLLLVKSQHHGFLFQHPDSFPDLVPFSGQRVTRNNRDSGTPPCTPVDVSALSG